MEHFSIIVLQKYYNHELSEAKRVEVENHLSECEICQTAFLGIFDANSSGIPEETTKTFTDDVLAAILHHKHAVKRMYIKKRKRHLLVMYAAAACLTISFASIGLFNTASNVLSDTSLIISRAAVSFDEMLKSGISGSFSVNSYSTVNTTNRKDGITIEK